MPVVTSAYLSESQLVAALQRGEARAQKEVYEQLASKMMAVCIRYVSTKDDAEDVLVEGFMRVFDRIMQFREQGSLEGWIRRIMVTESLMFLRKRKSWQQEVAFDTLVVEPEQSWSDVGLQADDLLRLVAELPDGYRTIFNLYAIEGYSHAEISVLLGISEGTSKSQLSRARTLLQHKLNRMELAGNKVFKSYGKPSN